MTDSSAPQPAERIEYRPASAPPVTCGCPRVVHNVDRPDSLLKVWHRPGCTAGDLSSTVPPPRAPRPAPGAVPCPQCGNVAFAWATGGQTGPEGVATQAPDHHATPLDNRLRQDPAARAAAWSLAS